MTSTLATCGVRSRTKGGFTIFGVVTLSHFFKFWERLLTADLMHLGFNAIFGIDGAALYRQVLNLGNRSEYESRRPNQAFTICHDTLPVNSYWQRQPFIARHCLQKNAVVKKASIPS